MRPMVRGGSDLWLKSRLDSKTVLYNRWASLIRWIGSKKVSAVPLMGSNRREDAREKMGQQTVYCGVIYSWSIGLPWSMMAPVFWVVCDSPQPPDHAHTSFLVLFYWPVPGQGRSSQAMDTAWRLRAVSEPSSSGMSPIPYSGQWNESCYPLVHLVPSTSMHHTHILSVIH